jgi:ABC-type nitrate/sulfonate/bicarbonate transport system substrate-binding protein
MQPDHGLSRRAIAALAIASLLVLPASRSPAASGLIRVGYQKNGALLILKQQRRLEARLAPIGLAVECFEFSSGPPMLEALNADGIDFAATGDMPPIFAQAAGTDLVCVASQPAPGRSSARGAAASAGSGCGTISRLISSASHCSAATSRRSR